MADRSTTIDRLRINFMRVVRSFALALGMLIGAIAIENGARGLFATSGQDFVMTADRVGELDVVSTRHLTLNWEGMLLLCIGFAIIAASLAMARMLHGRAPSD